MLARNIKPGDKCKSGAVVILISENEDHMYVVWDLTPTGHDKMIKTTYALDLDLLDIKR